MMRQRPWVLRLRVRSEQSSSGERGIESGVLVQYYRPETWGTGAPSPTGRYGARVGAGESPTKIRAWNGPSSMCTTPGIERYF